MIRLRLAFVILITALTIAACATKRPAVVAGGGGEPKAAPGGRSGETAAPGAPGGRGGAGRGGGAPTAGAPPAAPASAPPPPPPPPAPDAPRAEEAAAEVDRPDVPATSAGPSRPAGRRAPRSEIEIFYGTNRARRSTCDQASTVKWNSSPACRPNSFYTGDPARRDERHPDDLEVGRFRVAFPPDHQPGIIERPTVLTIELGREDPSRHVVISELSSFGTDYEAWVRAVKGSGKKDAFIYVHGYYTSFEAAARQAGQLAFDLEIDRDFEGVPMLYTWPSQGTLKGYLLDYDRSRAAARAFNQFLDLVKQRAGLSRIHIVAHSMGNLLVANALQSRWSGGRQEKFLEQLVLAAPDISAEDFRDQFLKTLPQLAKRVTLYVSDNDKALRTSAGLRDGIPRAGLLEGGLMSVSEPGFEVVDATPLPADFLDHSYYSNNRSMLADIYCLLGGSAPSGRPLIMAAGVNWAFRPPAVLAALQAKACAASQDRLDTSVIPPFLQPPPPATPASPRRLLWLTGLMALVVVLAAGYVIARRRRRVA